MLCIKLGEYKTKVYRMGYEFVVMHFPVLATVNTLIWTLDRPGFESRLPYLLGGDLSFNTFHDLPESKLSHLQNRVK